MRPIDRSRQRVNGETAVGGDLLAVEFGRHLRRHRHRAGLTQGELGLRASLHRTEIGLLERGQRAPRLNTLIKLAGALSISLNDLLEFAVVSKQ